MRRIDGTRSTEVIVRDILDRYQVREILECRAVFRAAELHARDLRPARELLGELNGVIAQPDRVEWNRSEIAFHRAVNNLGGNPVLAAMAEATHRDVQKHARGAVARAALRADRRLQLDHHAILAAISAGDADEAVEHMRGHIRFLRDTLSAALQSAR